MELNKDGKIELINLAELLKVFKYDLNGKELKEGDVVILDREPFRNKKAIYREDTWTGEDLTQDKVDNSKAAHYELIDDPSVKIRVTAMIDATVCQKVKIISHE